MVRENKMVSIVHNESDRQISTYALLCYIRTPFEYKCMGLSVVVKKCIKWLGALNWRRGPQLNDGVWFQNDLPFWINFPFWSECEEQFSFPCDCSISKESTFFIVLNHDLSMFRLLPFAWHETFLIYSRPFIIWLSSNIRMATNQHTRIRRRRRRTKKHCP